MHLDQPSGLAVEFSLGSVQAVESEARDIRAEASNAHMILLYQHETEGYPSRSLATKEQEMPRPLCSLLHLLLGILGPRR